MEKTPCRDCGTLILPETAERTGGLCMPCKQGIRKDIEAAKAYYKNQKVSPKFLLWNRLCKKFGGTEFLEFSDVEKLYFAVEVLSNSVHRGGFGAYFFNSSGDTYELAVEGLEKICAREALETLKAAAAIVFGKKHPPVETDERRQIIIAAGNEKTGQLGLLDKKFCNFGDQLDKILEQFAEENGLYFQ